MLYLIAVVMIPIIAVFLLFISAADDFWQIIRLQISFGRLFGDLIHVLLILVIGFLAEAFCIFELISHLL